MCSNFTQLAFVTARVSSTREGTVFTGVCLLTFTGGYLPSGWWGGTYSGLDGGGGGVPTLAGVGGYIPWLGWGVPTLARVGGYLPMAGVGGTYLGQGGGVPTLAQGRYSPHLE